MLLVDRQTHPGIEGLAYFYCDPKDRACWEPDMVLRALLAQLCTTLDAASVYGAVVRAWEKGYLPTKSVLIELLGVHAQSTLIVYGAGSALLEVLAEVVLAAKGTVRVFVAGGSGEDLTSGVEESMGLLPVIALEMANEGDINILLDASTTGMKNLGAGAAGENEEEEEEEQAAEEVRQLICSTLRAKADGW